MGLTDIVNGQPDQGFPNLSDQTSGLSDLGADLANPETSGADASVVDSRGAGRQFDLQGADHQFGPMGDAQTIGRERGQQFRLNASGPAITKFTTKFDPETGQPSHAAEFSGPAWEYMQQMVQIGQQAMKARDVQIAEIQKKKDLIDQNPIIAQVGRLASLAAGQYFAPGDRGAALVRGAGLFGGETFGKTSEQLAGEIADKQTGKYGLAANVEQRAIELERTIQEDKRTNAIIKQNEINQDLERRRQNSIEQQRVEQRWTGVAGKGLLTPGAEAQIVKEVVAAGGTKEDGHALYQTLQAQDADAKKTKGMEVRTSYDDQGRQFADTYKDGKFVSSQFIRRGPKTFDMLQKEQQQKDDHELAVGLARGDRDALSALGGIGAGGRRLSIVADAKREAAKMGQKFETSDLQNRIDLFKEYTVPDPGGKNAASSMTQFNTLNEHIGEALNKIEAAGLMSSKLWNTPMNKWKDSVEGNVALAALKQALQPVDEEYGTMIRAGKAAFVRDKAALDDLYDSNRGPQQLIEILRGSATTTSDRLREIGNTYKRGTGQEFTGRNGEGMVSPEAARTLVRLQVPFVGGPTLDEMKILNARGSDGKPISDEEKRRLQAQLPADRRSDGGQPIVGGGGGF